MQTIAINLGSTHAGATLFADLLDSEGNILATVAEGYTDYGQGSYVWEMDIPAAAVAIRIYDATETLLVMAVEGADSIAVSGDLLAGFKEYLRRADEGELDAMLSLLLLSALAELADIAGRAISTTEPRVRLWVYARAAAMFNSPESHTDRPISESSAFQMLTNSLRAYFLG